MGDASTECNRFKGRILKYPSSICPGRSVAASWRSVSVEVLRDRDAKEQRESDDIDVPHRVLVGKLHERDSHSSYNAEQDAVNCCKDRQWDRCKEGPKFPCKKTDLTVWTEELQILSREPNKKQQITKYGEEYHKPSWYLDHPPTSNFCQPKEANVFTASKKKEVFFQNKQ